MSNGTNTYSYKYNDSGIRTEKTVNGVTTKYYLEGTKVIYEKTGDNLTYYTYDEAGEVIGINYNNTQYYYQKNAQGDIIGILDSNLNKVVAYTYDTWGKVVSITDGSGAAITDQNNIGYKNPYLYRGYRYDRETGLYYLQSRYYNPDWGRFINADGQLNVNSSLIGTNMYVYCNNNPANLTDQNGTIPFFAITAIVGAVVGAIAGGIIAHNQGKNVWAGIGIGAAAGALIGAGAGALVAAVTTGGGAAAVGTVSTAITTAISSGAGQKVASTPQAIGKAGEIASGIIKNTETIIMNNHDRIPDMYDGLAKIMGEVKNVANLSYTSQLRDYFSYAVNNGFTMNLWIRQTTVLSKPLINAITQNDVIIRLLPW